MTGAPIYDFLLTHESAVRLGIFGGTLLFFSFIELVFPARPTASSKAKHVLDNLSIGLLGSLLLRVTPGILAANVALFCEANSIGLMYLIGMNSEALFVLAFFIIFLDMSIYWQHRLFHMIPALWRLHRVHHSDPHLDASSALRFHPIEIFISMLIKSTLVASLGIPFIAVVLFEVILNASAIFNHTNFRLPKTIEPIARSIFVTPTMHRVHHSVDLSDSNRNFGFCLSIWDRFFGSYRSKSKTGESNFAMGVKKMPSSKSTGTWQLIKQPFE